MARSQRTLPHLPTGYGLGIDVGGTKIAAGLVDLTAGRVVERRALPTDAARGPVAVLNTIVGLAEGLAAVPGAQLAAVGIGVPELVDLSGTIRSAFILDWSQIPLQKALGHLGPVQVEADVRAHARAEARYGAGRQFGLFVYLSVGTGISSCLVQDGQPYAGARGNALVLSSGPLTTPCPHCNELHSFVLEEYAAGAALPGRYNALGNGHAVRAEELFSAAAAGDLAAEQVLRSAGTALGSSAGWLVNILDPEAIVVGGGLGLADGHYWASFVDAVRNHIWADDSRSLPLLRATLGADAGIVGAALAAFA